MTRGRVGKNRSPLKWFEARTDLNFAVGTHDACDLRKLGWAVHLEGQSLVGFSSTPSLLAHSLITVVQIFFPRSPRRVLASLFSPLSQPSTLSPRLATTEERAEFKKKKKKEWATAAAAQRQVPGPLSPATSTHQVRPPFFLPLLLCETEHPNSKP